MGPPPQGPGGPEGGRPGGDRPQGGTQAGGMGDRLKALDKNKNGNLEADELPEQFRDRMLERLDRNSDSVISKEELAEAAKAMGNRGGQPKGGKGKGGAPPEGGGSVKPKRPPLEE